MPIVKTFIKPNGAILSFHCAKSIATVDFQAATAVVNIGCWPSEQAYNDAHAPDWMEPVQVSTAELANVEAAIVAHPSNPFSGGAIVADQSGTLDAAKIRRKAVIDAERERRNALPIDYAGASFDADERGQRNVQAWQTQLAAGAALPPGFVWRDAANSDHPADAAFVNGLGEAITLRGTQLYAQGWSLKAQIDAAATIAEVQSIAWPA